MLRFGFNSLDRIAWFKQVCEIRLSCTNEKSDEVLLTFAELNPTKVHPEHVVTLACLIEDIIRNGHQRVIIDTSPLGLFLWDKCRLRQYWGENQNYSKSPDDTILNLWRINQEGKSVHGEQVTSYLRNMFFKNKDLSAVGNSLTEAYFNVFDHADAKGNAFSMLMFDEETCVLRVAVCDFGIGVAKTVKDFINEDIPDKDAIDKAMQDNFTIESTSHNKGFGLRNIRDCCTEKDSLWILSNTGALVFSDGNVRKMDMDFHFGGSLIFYSVSLSHFEDEEIIADFSFNF